MSITVEEIRRLRDRQRLSGLARDPDLPVKVREAARNRLAALAANSTARARATMEQAVERMRHLTANVLARSGANKLKESVGIARRHGAPRIIAGKGPAAAAVDVRRSTNFDALAAEYEETFAAARLRAETMDKTEAARRALIAHSMRYRKASAATGVPWVFIGLTHGLEAGWRFDRHLHNGDPLTARTRRVPAGRPAAGEPPFTWEESAADAMVYMKLDKVRDWSLPRLLYELERYNGFGYRYKAQPSPYLWSFTDRYREGKYVADGVYDPKAVSKQVGAAAVLLRLAMRDELDLSVG